MTAPIAVSIGEFEALLEGRLNAAQQGSALLVGEAISVGNPRLGLPGTPVDTGYARSSWVVGVNQPPAFSGASQNPVKVSRRRGVPRPPVLPPATLGPSVLGVTADDEITFASNTAYMARLEYEAHSPQAPAGFVRLTAAAWPRIVAMVAKRLKVGR